MSLLKSNFPTKSVEPEEAKPLDPKAEFERKAKESIGGSMVFTERKLRYWDGTDEVSGTAKPDSADRA
jgi:hypothetical protein